MINKPWYQFTVELNDRNLELSQVKFSEPPREKGEVGQKIHHYLLKLGMYEQCIPGLVESTLYCFNEASLENEEISEIASGLKKLHQKFAPKGAELIVSTKGKMTITKTTGGVSREEFETLKKQSAIADQELQELERRLKDLSEK